MSCLFCEVKGPGQNLPGCVCSNKREIGLIKYYDDIKLLAQQIKPHRDKYGMILAVSRGGTIVGTYLSHALDLPMGVIAAKSYEKDHSQRAVQLSAIAMVDEMTSAKPWLIAEDLLDTGKTLEAIRQKYSSWQFDVAALYHKGKCPAPDFFVERLNEWLVFPYEDFC